MAYSGYVGWNGIDWSGMVWHGFDCRASCGMAWIEDQMQDWKMDGSVHRQYG